MKRISEEELPKELTQEIIEILVDMAREFPPKTNHWSEVSDVLEERGQLDFIIEKARERNKKDEEEAYNSLPEEEKKRREDIFKKEMEDPEPKFYGNIGEPETPEEYKRKYGIDPKFIKKE